MYARRRTRSAPFLAGVDFTAYAENAMIHSAVERKFEIIGEALNPLAKADPLLAARLPDPAEIIAFRNLLVHAYAVVEHSRVVAHSKWAAAGAARGRGGAAG